MAKNALQAQLLKAGLVDSKKAKKLSKQSQHAKRTGDAENIEAKKALAEAQAKQREKDQLLNQERQRALEEKTLTANIIQMIKQHQITETQGEVTYQFVDDSKIKKIYITQKLYDQVVAGHVVIARLEEATPSFRVHWQIVSMKSKKALSWCPTTPQIVSWQMTILTPLM